jgi:hypothetical protein
MARRPDFRDHACVDGRAMRHDPQPDDPYLQTDVGPCEKCDGKGCDNLEKEDDEMTDEYAAEVRAVYPDITDAGLASFWRARHLPTD